MHNQWGMVIQLKAQELSNYYISMQKVIDFGAPKPALESVDKKDLRKKILELSYVEWEKMGFSRGTLHYMKQNAKGKKSFTLNAHVRKRIESRG